ENVNNQIQNIISDIDVNIKAQENITKLKEQELKLIQKQNELASEIQQQQMLAQQLSAQNQVKLKQLEQNTQSEKRAVDLHPSQSNPTYKVSTFVLSYLHIYIMYLLEKRSGYRPSDLYDRSKREFLLKLSQKLWKKNHEYSNASKTVDLRKIFTPATDSEEILPKNRKLYASSAFYSPTLHPTVEDQVELARRISHSLSDISNQTSKGQSMYVNRKKRSVKWVHEGSAQESSHDVNVPCKNNSDSNSTAELTMLGTMPLKLIMNPRGQVRDYNSLKELINVESGLLSPDNCAELITALQLHQGRGAELFAKRRKKSDNWVVDDNNTGTQCHLSGIPDYKQYPPKAATSPNILPAYSDAGKHRVQLNIHQNQLIEKYSKPGVQVIKSPWEAALQTGSASTAFLEQPKDRNFTTAVESPIYYLQNRAKDLTDSNIQYPIQKNEQGETKSDYVTVNVLTNSQRELAYTPSVAQGWGGRNVELPKEDFNLNTYKLSMEDNTGLNNDTLTHNPSDYLTDFAINVQDRLLKLELFQKHFLQQQPATNKLQSNIYHSQPANKNERLIYQNTELKKRRINCATEKENTNVAEEKCNVRELIQSFEQQSLTDLKNRLFVPKEISLSSYAPPPKLYTGVSPDFEPSTGSSPNFNSFSNRGSFGTHSGSKFPFTKPYSNESPSLKPPQKMLPATSYKTEPHDITHIATPVNFSPTPLSYDKLAPYEKSQRFENPKDQQYLSILKPSNVRNISPTPFGLALNKPTSRCPSSVSSFGPVQDHSPKTTTSRCDQFINNKTSSTLQQGQSFNARPVGWGPGSNYRKNYQCILQPQNSLPYSDF
ncbi:hypothetical protein KR018_003686, partial [Drosophila ironensis]